MRTKVLFAMVISATTFAQCLPAWAGEVQIGDFRLDADEFPTLTYFDPGYGSLHGSALTTRSVIGAPVAVNSDLSGTSQNAGNPPADSTDDIGLQTNAAQTNLRQINRNTSDPDGPGAGTGAQRVGAVQWTFDLTPIDSYLTTTGQFLTALDLDLLTNPSDDTKSYDVYLSYTNAAESIARTDISISPSTNYSDFWLPSQTASEGDIIGGEFKILELQFAGDLSLSESLLPLYNSGVREFNLIVTTGDFWSGRNLQITAGSGLSITAVPESSSIALASFGILALGIVVWRRRFSKS